MKKLDTFLNQNLIVGSVCLPDRAFPNIFVHTTPEAALSWQQMDLRGCVSAAEPLSFQAVLESGGRLTEVIAENPPALVDAVLDSGCWLSSVIWWEKAATGPVLGMGGHLDPRDPENTLFAEIAHLDREFPNTTTRNEYLDYIRFIRSQYPDLDLYPGFDIAMKSNP